MENLESKNNFCPKCCSFKKFVKKIKQGLNGKVCGKCLNRQHKNTQYSKLKPISRKITNYAVKHGFLKKQPCEVCGRKKVDAHHENYHKPLNIRWLCEKHHQERHRELKAKLLNK